MYLSKLSSSDYVARKASSMSCGQPPCPFALSSYTCCSHNTCNILQHFAFLFWITNYPRAQWHHILFLYLELGTTDCSWIPSWLLELFDEFFFEWLQITVMTGGPCCCMRCQNWVGRCAHPLRDALNLSAALATQEDHLITSLFNCYW